MAKATISTSVVVVTPSMMLSDQLCCNTHRMFYIFNSSGRERVFVRSSHFNSFVYDLKTGSKKKLGTNVSFPETLDMSLSAQSNGLSCSSIVLIDLDSLIYHLSAVLLHRGPSASAGHYMAQVKELSVLYIQLCI